MSEPVEFSWQSTPALWMAVRANQCWCEDCRHKNARGFGKTPSAAEEALLEDEASRDD